MFGPSEAVGRVDLPTYLGIYVFVAVVSTIIIEYIDVLYNFVVAKGKCWVEDRLPLGGQG